MSEDDQLDQDDLMEDVEMASIAEEEDLDEKFSHQGTSTGKVNGRKKIVSCQIRKLQNNFLMQFF